MSSLLKQMCSLKCRISVDLINGSISITDMDDNDVDSIIDAVNEAFEISSIDIVPSVVVPEPEKPVITEDSIEFEKVEFNDTEVQEQVNKLLRIIYWAMYSNKAKSRDICQYLMSTGTEIAMKYNPKVPTKFAIGDIVDCNYGSHLKNEISGGHVHSIICDIDENEMVYAVPITKTQIENDETRYLQFAANIDVEYNDARFAGGTVLLNMGRYIHQLRVIKVVGHALPEFFHKILIALPATVSFSSKYDNYEDQFAEKFGDVSNDDSMLSFESSEEPEVKKIEDDSVEEISGKVISSEDYVADIIADALNSLDKSKPVEDQIDNFLDAIGLSKNVLIVRNAFIAACSVDKVTYNNLVIELQKEMPKVRGEIIKLTLKNEFKKWLSNHPDVIANYSKISIIVLLKLFAKKMS